MTKNERLGLIALACMLAAIVALTLLSRQGDESGPAVPVSVVDAVPEAASPDTVGKVKVSSASEGPQRPSRKGKRNAPQSPPHSNVRDPRSQNVTR